MPDFTQDRSLKIGEVARLSGFPVKTIRYYEERGLLEPAARTETGYRLYSRVEVERLKFIKRAKLLGLKLGEISDLVELAADCTGGELIPRLEDVLESKLQETRRQITELTAFRDNLLYYQRMLPLINPEQSCDRSAMPEAGFCGCLEAMAGGPATDNNSKEVRMKNLEIVEENGRLVAARDECCDYECCGYGCCEGDRCECC